MARSFGEHLSQFAQTVGVINPEIFAEIKELVQQYVRQALRVEYFEFMRAAKVNNRAGLVTLWPSDGLLSNSIRDAKDNYNGQTAYVFDKNTELWVVSKDRSPLAGAAEYEDLWWHRGDLPAYHNPGPIREPISTAIMLPLRDHDDQPFGVLDFEASRYIGITEVAKRELTLIAKSLSRLYLLEQSNIRQRDSTRNAVHELEKTLKSKYLPRLSKPVLFLAYSSRADDSVVRVIRNVLDEFEDKLEVVVWSRINRSGNVTIQIIDSILSSKYGICYFSEPAIPKNPANEYQDNPNVLIEAGMLHAIYNTDAEPSDGWIPIREPDSPPLPFDFIAERIQQVARRPNGELNEEQFKHDLRERINNLINS